MSALLSVAVATLTLGTAGGASAWQRPQERGQQPVFRAGVELVVFNVAVLDEDGAPVTDLVATDFRVRQGGVEQAITLFATPDESALDVALVLDASSSIADSAPRIREDAMAFLEALGPSDCVYFVPFAQGLGETVWAAPQDPLLAARIGGIDLIGGTALYEALIEGLSSVDRRGLQAVGAEAAAVVATDSSDCGQLLPPATGGRPGAVRRTAVVVLSDGGDEHSLATYADTLGVARLQAIPIHAVAIGDAVAPGPRARSASARRAGTVCAANLPSSLPAGSPF